MHTIGSVLGVLSMLMFVGGPLLAYLRVLPPLAGFGLMALGGLVGFLAATAAITGVISASSGPSLGFLGLPPALFMIYGIILGMSVPRINDISTDLEDPPAFDKAHSFPGNAGRDLSFPEDFAPQIESRYPTVQPLAVGKPADETFEAVKRVAESWPPLQQMHVDADTRTIEGFVETRMFRFHDDVVIRVRPLDAGSRIDMRSKSRDGQGDFGANAKRIGAFFDLLRGEMKEIQP